MKFENEIESIKTRLLSRVNIKTKWDYFLVYLIFANSAVPFFYPYIEFKVINLLVLLLFFIIRNKNLDKFLFIYLFFFMIVIVGQFYTFNIFSTKDYLTILIRIFIAYLTIKIVSIRFFHIFRNIIFVFAIISLFFYLPAISIPGFTEFFGSKISPYLMPPFNDVLKNQFSNQIIVFNFNQIDLFRNSGPCWEPGTFGGYLIIAIVINTIITGCIFEKKNIIMMIALLTTLSTTNYIAFFIFILIYLIFIQKKINSLIFVLPLAAIFITLFFEISFLQDKINSQVNNINEYYYSGKIGNRFVSAAVDIQYFLKYPIWGKGRSEISNKLHSRFEDYRTNGLATYLADFGLIFFLFYFFCMYLSISRFCSIYNLSKYLSFALLFILLLIGFSEEYYNFPFFYALTMFHLAIPSQLIRYLKFKKRKQNIKLGFYKITYGKMEF